MKQRSRAQIRLIVLAFAGLGALLALLLWQGLRRGSAVRVGIPRTPAAYGAAMLLQTPSAQYRCTLGSTAAAVKDALEAGDLDAALLPYELAQSAAGCRICAVAGYDPLLLLTREEEIAGLSDLSGARITLMDALRGTRQERWLRALLRQAEVRCELVYGSEGALMICAAEDAEALLRQNAGWRVCLSFAEAWRKALASNPPAGLCLAVRQDYLDKAGTDYAAFLRALERSMQYSDEKRKKTSAMAAAAGLADSEEMADALYPWLDYVFLTGEQMEAALNAG